jgi:hypothetical protein
MEERNLPRCCGAAVKLHHWAIVQGEYWGYIIANKITTYQMLNHQIKIEINTSEFREPNQRPISGV